MDKEEGSEEIEWTVNEWLQHKYGNHLIHVDFINLWKESGIFIVDCNVTVKKGVMGKEMLTFKFQVSGLGKILGYKTLSAD